MLPNILRRAPEDAPPKGSVQARGGGLVRLVLTVLLVAWVVRSFLFAPFSIPSGSMLPALYIGDYVLTAKWPYGYSRHSFPFGFPAFDGRILASLPERGDIVVFRPTGAQGDFVKRVIGLPGDTIEIRGGMLILNGRPIRRESAGRAEVPITANSPCRVVPGATPMTRADAKGSERCLYPAYRETLPGGRSWLVLDQVDSPHADTMAATRVPADHVFLMGDNRDDSLDSRYSPTERGVGFVPVENLIGRAMIVFWSTDGSADYAKPWTWFTALRGDRFGTTFNGAER